MTWRPCRWAAGVGGSRVAGGLSGSLGGCDVAPWGGFVGVIGRVTRRNRGVVLWLLGAGDVASVGGVIGGVWGQ